MHQQQIKQQQLSIRRVKLQQRLHNIHTNPHIPKKIFQTHKSIQYVHSKPHLLNAMNSWKKSVPEFEYHFFNDQECNEFMKTHFSGPIYDAYNKVPLSVMKADLWRYCVIYHYGGIYADIDTVCNIHPKHLLKGNSQLICVPENETHMCQWLFAAPPKSPILKQVIDLSVDRILSMDNIKGEHIIHELTGPGVFTHGIEQYLQLYNRQTFTNKKEYTGKNDDVLFILNREDFRTIFVTHLFAGQDSDGWTLERNNTLM